MRHHLLLVETATRRDLDDPATVTAVADELGTTEVLELLAALTRADALATGPAAWSEWKAGLVDDLVRRTALRLHGAPPPPPPPLTPAQTALVTAGRLAVVAEPDEAVTWTVTVAAPDRTGLFATIAGVLALHRLSVRSAQVRTEDGHGAGRLDRGARPRPRAAGRGAAQRHGARAGRRPRRDPAAHRRGTPAAGSRPARRRRRGSRSIEAASATATVLEVRAGDRPGLLYRLGRALALMGVNIRGARVVTLGAEAVDVFYLQDAAGEPLSDLAAREAVRLLTDAAG